MAKAESIMKNPYLIFTANSGRKNSFQASALCAQKNALMIYVSLIYLIKSGNK
jgi:hypothetical protein